MCGLASVYARSGSDARASATLGALISDTRYAPILITGPSERGSFFLLSPLSISLASSSSSWVGGSFLSLSLPPRNLQRVRVYIPIDNVYICVCVCVRARARACRASVRR